MPPLRLLILVCLSCTRTTTGATTHEVDLGSRQGRQTWTMCRSSSDKAAAAFSLASSSAAGGFDCPESDLIETARVPGTALVNLLGNGTFASDGVDLDTVFVDDYLSRVPDINVTGGTDFYTFIYRTDIDISALDGDCLIA